MTLPINTDYRVQRLVDSSGPVFKDGLPVYVTRCGAEMTGTRRDGLSADMHPCVFLGETGKLDVRPVGPAPSVGFSERPAPRLLLPAIADGDDIGTQATPLHDREVWVTHPCVPGSPPQRLPLGGHLAAPLKATLEGLPVYADGCVECRVPSVCRTCDACYPGNFPSNFILDSDGFDGPCGELNGEHDLPMALTPPCSWSKVFPSGARYDLQITRNQQFGFLVGTVTVSVQGATAVYTGRPDTCCSGFGVDRVSSNLPCSSPLFMFVLPEIPCVCVPQPPPPDCTAAGLCQPFPRLMRLTIRDDSTGIWFQIRGTYIMQRRLVAPFCPWIYRNDGATGCQLLEAAFDCGPVGGFCDQLGLSFFFPPAPTFGQGTGPVSCNFPAQRIEFDASGWFNRECIRNGDRLRATIDNLP